MSSTREQSDPPNRRTRGRQVQSESTNRPSASVNMDELRELIALLRENGLAEFELEREGFRVRLRREGTSPGPVPFAEANTAAGTPGVSKPTMQGSPHGATNPAPSPGALAKTEASKDQDLHIIPSPIVGTFYRSPSPTAEAFVKIGSNVEPETVVCIIEAMKLMNEIQAEAAGEVVKIYVENGQPVEYGQPLFGIKG